MCHSVFALSFIGIFAGPANPAFAMKSSAPILVVIEAHESVSFGQVQRLLNAATDAKEVAIETKTALQGAEGIAVRIEARRDVRYAVVVGLVERLSAAGARKISFGEKKP